MDNVREIYCTWMTMNFRQENHMDEINHMTKLHNTSENDCSLCMWISVLPLQTSLLADHVGPFISKKFHLHRCFQIILEKVFALNYSLLFFTDKY
jgi:hypothetical protein